MGHVYIFDKNAEDFSTTGLCGALTPTVCEHEEIAGGMSAITLEHPFDELGRWKHLQRGNVIKAPCRVRTTPEIEGGQAVTAVERWSVKTTATQAQRGVYSKATKGKRKATAKPGTEVIVVAKGAERYKIKWGKAAGWIAHAALDFVLAETLPDGVNGIETVAPPWIVKPQLFRIQSVDADTDAGNITVYATHISYDLSYNLTRYKNDEPLTAQDALDGIFGSCDFLREVEAYTDIADTRTSAEWVNISPVEALLDPENGFCVRWGAELVRDDFEMYFLRRAGRDRGVRLLYGKNLLGVTCETSDEQVATAILPLGEKKDGSPLYLTDYPDNYDNYVMSPHAAEYPFERAYVLKCDDCTVEKGKKGVTLAVARARMLEQAQRLFDEDEIDLPSINMTVNFLALGDTIEYAQYKDLEPVYLYDTVPVIDKRHGIEVITDVHRVLWDCLLERMIEIELGNVRAGENIYSWQIPSLDGKKLNGGSVPGSAIEDGAIPEDKLDAAVVETIRKAKEDIESATALIGNTRDWLNTVEGAVRDAEGNVAALEVAATEIRAGLTDAENNLAVLSLRADEIQTAVTNAEGDISTIRQRADEIASTVASVSGELSTIRQSVSSISLAVSGLDGRVAALEVSFDGVSITVKDTSGPHQVKINSSGGFPSISFWYNSAGIGEPDVVMSAGAGGFGVTAGYDTIFFGAATDLDLGPMGAEFGGNVIPADGYAGTATVGTASARWKQAFWTTAANVSSDLRLKQDVEPLDAADLLDRLTPIRYRLKADSRTLHFGLGAQSVQRVIKGTNYADAALVSDENPNALGICYEELIPVLIEAYQREKAHNRSEIAALRAEIAAMKGGSA